MPGKSVIKWLHLSIWIVVIFSLSSISSLPSRYPEGPGGMDKLAHFFEYGVLAVLFYRALNGENTRKVGLICFLVIVSGIGIAAVDEIYQGHTGRDSSFYDGIADTMGVVAGTLASYVYFGREKRPERS